MGDKGLAQEGLSPTRSGAVPERDRALPGVTPQREVVNILSPI